MSLIVPNEGEVALLDFLVAGGVDVDGRLRLFQNNITPDQSTVYGDMTVANFSGYGETTPSFGTASTVANKAKITDSSARTFTHNGGATANTIYGYYYVDSANSVLLWAERFAAPIVMDVVGDNIIITLALTLNSEN